MSRKTKNNRFFTRLNAFVEGVSLTEDDVSLGEGPLLKLVDTGSPENEWLQNTQDTEKSPRARFQAWFNKYGVGLFTSLYRAASVLICIVIIGLLLSVVMFLPPFGSADNPTVNEVVDRYVSRGIEEAGTVNSVAGMISAYRGFDTLGEAHVLFVAACSVMVLLRVDASSRKKSNAKILDALGKDMDYEPNSDLILSTVSKLLVPLSFLLGLYVILNGTSSPGGGFSGGAIIGAGLILNTVAFGFKRTERFFSEEVYHITKTVCLTLYALLMAYFIYMGANGFDNHIWLGIPGTILSGGIILPINIAVGFEVACTMYSFYALFRKGGF